MLDSNRLVVLVDGSSYLFRAFHALPPLKNRAGHPTGAMHGVIKMLANLYEDYQPHYFAVIFDAKGKTFRHQLFSDYKAHRPAMPDELRVQIAPLLDLIKALGFPLIVEEGVEADDVIGTLAKKALADGYRVLISSGDKDMAQLLIHDDITLIDTMKNEATTASDVGKRFKVDELRAEQVVDFLALVGDKADNIPGVEKVGGKTAAKWLKEYGSVENIIHNASKISGKVGENLRHGIETLRLSQELARIRCDLDLKTQIADLALGAQNDHKIEKLCDEFELNSIKNKYLNKDLKKPEKTITANYQCVLSDDDWQALLARLKQAKHFALDCESTSLDYAKMELVGMSFALQEGEAYYLPLAHELVKNLPLKQIIEDLKPILEDEKIQKIGQHLKYDSHLLAKYGIALKGIEDTMLMSYCLNSTATRHNLDALADYYLNYKTTSFEEIAGKGKKQLIFSQIPLDIATQYACEDADIALRLYYFFKNNLPDALYKLYAEMERPLAQVLYQMEDRGVFLDDKALKTQSADLKKEIDGIEEEAYAIAGEDFNLNSPKQLQYILFEKLELPVLEKTPKGQASTNESALEGLVREYDVPLARLILKHRSLSKLKSTYTDKLPQLINHKTGRVHTHYHQAITSTGRLSSSDPNLQNIPIRSQEGRRIRQAFIAREGFQILAADYSQIELRIMAHLSSDEGLLSAFQNNEDVHAKTASEVFSRPLELVSREERSAAKAINFGLIYGMSSFGLARELNISRREAEQYMENYFTRYPKVADYMQKARNFAKENGYVETIFGRRLYLPDINNKNPQRRAAAERLAINAPMQGSAADIIKKAMIAIANKAPELMLIMQVHDELVFEVEKEMLENTSAFIKAEMENACTLKVPLEVAIGIADNWESAH